MFMGQYFQNCPRDLHKTATSQDGVRNLEPLRNFFARLRSYLRLNVGLCELISLVCGKKILGTTRQS